MWAATATRAAAGEKRVRKGAVFEQVLRELQRGADLASTLHPVLVSCDRPGDVGVYVGDALRFEPSLESWQLKQALGGHIGPHYL